MLAGVAEKAGLDGEAARDVLVPGRYGETFAAPSDWRSRGAGCGRLISGGQPPEVFEQALRKIAAEVA